MSEISVSICLCVKFLPCLCINVGRKSALLCEIYNLKETENEDIIDVHRIVRLVEEKDIMAYKRVNHE